MEMLVVLAIISILSLVVITGQSSFNRTLILANTAYDIGLSLRDAQTYGIASRGTSGGIFNAGYGVEFSSGSPTSFILFADTYPPVGANARPDAHPGNGIYELTQPNNDALVQTYTLNNNIKISDFCGTLNGVSQCLSAGTASRLDIVFARPNTSASITTLNGITATAALATACITVAAPSGETRVVVVTSIGEIEFRPVNSTCP